MCSSNFAFEGWQESKCVYWKVPIGLKCARTSRMECFLNRSPLYTHVSKSVLSVPEISAENFIAGWKLFASSVKLFIASLFVFLREKMSSMILFQMSGMLGLWLIISVSTSAIKMRNWKLVSIECFVCSTYNFDSFLLRDVSVKASNVH